MKPYQSMLFVPGHKPSWAEKAVAAEADAIILDLEDSVPATDKADARKIVRETIGRLRGQDIRADVWVRPNSYDSGLFGADTEAVIVPGLAGLFLPKGFITQEIVVIDAVVPHIEVRESLGAGSVGLIISFETAASIASWASSVDELLDRHDTRLRRIEELVDRQAGTAAEVAVRLRWTRRERRSEELDLFNRRLAVSEALAHLDVLAVAGRLRRTGLNGTRHYAKA